MLVKGARASWMPCKKNTKPGLCSSIFCTGRYQFSIYQSLTVMMPLKYSGISSSSITASKSLKLTRMGSKGHLQGSPRRTNSSGHPSAKYSSNMPQTSSYLLQHTAGPPRWRHQMETFSALLATCPYIALMLFPFARPVLFFFYFITYLFHQLQIQTHHIRSCSVL